MTKAKSARLISALWRTFLTTTSAKKKLVERFLTFHPHHDDLTKWRSPFDLDGDGDVDWDDILLPGYWAHRTVQLIFDITLWVMPFGAIVGFCISIAGLIAIEHEFRAVRVNVESIIDEFEKMSFMPPVDEITVLGADLPTLQLYFEIAAIGILLVNMLVIANGVYTGMRTACRKAVQAQNDRICGCTPIDDRKRDRFGYWLCCCCSCAAGTLQAVWAVVGLGILWAVLAIAYVLSIAALALAVLLYLFRLYCKRVQPLVSTGLGLADSTLARANATVRFVEDAMPLHSGDGLRTWDLTAGRSRCSLEGLTTQPMDTVEASLLFSLSPVPDILNMVMRYFGKAESAVDTVNGVLYTACSFYEFLERLCVLTAGLPEFFVVCFLGSILVIIGQITMAMYHIRYFTVWYYEQAMRQRRRAVKMHHEATRMRRERGGGGGATELVA